MSNLQRHKDCTMRSGIGNCLAIGGFCTSVSKEICEGLQNAFASGKHSIEVSEEQLSKLKNCDYNYEGYCSEYDDGCFHQCVQKQVSEDDVYVYEIPLPNYCKDCGAKMKGADDDKA